MTMKLPAGTKVYIGPPAHPMAQEVSRAIGAALGRIPEIREGHLPMVYIEGKIDPPAQILVVVLEEGAASQQLKIKEIMRGLLPTGSYLDMLEWRPNNPTLPTVRRTDTALDLNRKLN
jgi:hypothetical protein